MSKKKTKRVTGTREWSDVTVNCILGCSHDCVYCYARYALVDRWHKIDRKDWSKMLVREKEVRKSRSKYNGIVMFPSTHDITPETLDPCMTVLEKLMDAGNEVLVVSKPHRLCVEAICRNEDWKDRLTFRFTIGGIDRLEMWEPGAPDYLERKDCLMFAFNRGWKTSISAEPLLEPWNVEHLYNALSPYVTGDFWIGKLNKPETRIKTDDEELLENIEVLVSNWQTDEAVMRIVKMLDGKPHIKWKDSYKEVIERCRIGK